MPEETSPPTCLTNVTIRRNPTRRARPTPTTTASKPRNISAFPLEDILSINLDEPPITTSADSASLKVFLRVRPLPTAPAKKTAKSKAAIKEQKVVKPKSCISVNDTHSVTVIPPNCDSNRSKSEVFTGFSHVFASDSSQDGVYETMMRPIVEEFLKGRSGLLAALGPSGSGKTHTVFGSVKDPGLVPRALRHIFGSDTGNQDNFLRSFYLSVFEIYSEKGKGEKLSDLSPDGADISMQQSVVRGLKEVLITDVAQAEAIIANAKSKRATALTNSNSQSSRSQCIINIRYAVDETTEESNTPQSGAVLTFVDLAGAEREKKTGNQGGRLLESNFINNTSMVFGLCLRSLLEHQKNPKKSLQKHFQSSLLTRYLRDYLEGRKRMALILTARSGPEDYFDISFLLRQASPYMEIKFHNVDETSDVPGNKRRIQNTCTEQQKRGKFSKVDEKIGKQRKTLDTSNISRDEAEFSDVLNQHKSDSNLEESKGTLTRNTDKNLQRHYHFMQGFAKACWSVLKQYKERVKAMQNEIDVLTENTRIEQDRYLEIEKELHQLRSWCSCPKQDPLLAICSGGEVGKTSVSEAGFTQNDYKTTLPGHREVSGEIVSSGSHSTSNVAVELQDPGPSDVCKVHQDESPSITETSLLPAEKIEPLVILERPYQVAELSSLDLELSTQHNHQHLPVEIEHSADSAINRHEKDLMDEDQNEFKDTTACLRQSHVMDVEPERPKRRLMPASSLLLRDVGSLDVIDENVKHRGGRGGQRKVEEGKISRGNASLFRLLKNNLSR